MNKRLGNYFKKKYYYTDLNIKFIHKLLSLANTSIDISDGLFTDLDKLINNQKLSYKLYLKNVPISQNLKRLINLKLIKKINCISKGDDYQILFTAKPSKSNIINKTGKTLGIKISKIGKICSPSYASEIIDEKKAKIIPKNKGYYHTFLKVNHCLLYLFLYCPPFKN